MSNEPARLGWYSSPVASSTEAQSHQLPATRGSSERAARTRAPSVDGNMKSSASRKVTNSPRADAMPVLRAAASPTLRSRRTSEIRGSSSAWRSTTAQVSSTDASSTTTHSHSRRSWRRTLFRAVSMNAPSSWAVITTVTTGSGGVTGRVGIVVVGAGIGSGTAGWKSAISFALGLVRCPHWPRPAAVRARRSPGRSRAWMGAGITPHRARASGSRRRATGRTSRFMTPRAGRSRLAGRPRAGRPSLR